MDAEHSRPVARTDGRFTSSLGEDRLMELLRDTARTTNPDDPERLSQRAFDQAAPTVARSKGWEPPPSARAIYMRFKSKATKSERPVSSWRALVARSLADKANPVMTAAAVTRREPHENSIDEALIYYALRRVAAHLGRTPSPDEYDQGCRELIADERRHRRPPILETTLPSSGQILHYAGGSGWDGACSLAGLEPREVPLGHVGADFVKLAWHYYESKEKLPHSKEELRRYAKELGVLAPERENRQIAELIRDLRKARAERGWRTPEREPAASERLSPDERAALLAGAGRLRPAWRLETALAALQEYLDAYEGSGVRLTQKHYVQARRGRPWPTLRALGRVGESAAIPGWRAWLDEARKRRRTERKAA
jgi:hypothetical protein